MLDYVPKIIEINKRKSGKNRFKKIRKQQFVTKSLPEIYSNKYS